MIMYLLLISAIVPVAIFCYFIYRKDTRKEPWNLLIKCLFAGFIAAAATPSLSRVFEIIEFKSSLVNSIHTAFICAAFTEELFKFLFLYYIIWEIKEFDEHYDGIVYAVFVSMGFALIENMGYVLASGYITAWYRAILAIPMHGLCGVVMGYYLSSAKFSATDLKKAYLILALLVPMLIHGIYDFIVMYQTALQIEDYINETSIHTVSITLLNIVLYVFMALVWRFALRRMKRHRHTDENIYKTQKSNIE
jgi:RsiW-degrading membrane proteinase PrsW (M82 family)